MINFLKTMPETKEKEEETVLYSGKSPIPVKIVAIPIKVFYIWLVLTIIQLGFSAVVAFRSQPNISALIQRMDTNANSNGKNNSDK